MQPPSHPAVATIHTFQHFHPVQVLPRTAGATHVPALARFISRNWYLSHRGWPVPARSCGSGGSLGPIRTGLSAGDLRQCRSSAPTDASISGGRHQHALAPTCGEAAHQAQGAHGSPRRASASTYQPGQPLIYPGPHTSHRRWPAPVRTTAGVRSCTCICA